MKFRHIHHVDQFTVDRMYTEYPLVFILSTGRAGSKFIADLLDCSENINAYHEPRPTFQYFSNYAFHHQKEDEILTRMIDASRMESILEVYIKDNIYVESNQCLTFFSPVLAKLFKRSKFVHLTRHPGDFIRSAVRKGWHRNDSIWESGRAKMKDQEKWRKMDQIEKLAWLWETTNRFIEDFKSKVDSSRHSTFKIEDLFSHVEKVNGLIKFIGGLSIQKDLIKKLQETKINEMIIYADEPPNMKKLADFPNYDVWGSGLKEKVSGYLKELASQYGYEL